MPTSSSITTQNSMASGLSAAVSLVMWGSVGLVVLACVAFLSALPSGLKGVDLSLLGFAIENRNIPASEIIYKFSVFLIMMIGIIYICFQLRNILMTLADGDPFVSANSNRLMKIASALAFMEIGRMVAIIASRQLLVFEPAETTPPFTISAIAWASAIAFFVLSQVFREGTRLRDDAKMTI